VFYLGSIAPFAQMDYSGGIYNALDAWKGRILSLESCPYFDDSLLGILILSLHQAQTSTMYKTLYLIPQNMGQSILQT
jgi:hypothetical protein